MNEYIERESFYRFLEQQTVKQTGAYSKGKNDGLNIAKSALHNLEITPAVNVFPAPQWISVKDRLPEKNGNYLVCTKAMSVFTTHYWTDETRWSHYTNHITHWMPLPDPPKEVTNA